MKQSSANLRKDANSELVTLSARVPRETAARLKQIADTHYRSLAAEVRRLVEERVESYEEQEEAA